MALFLFRPAKKAIHDQQEKGETYAEPNGSGPSAVGRNGTCRM